MRIRFSRDDSREKIPNLKSLGKPKKTILRHGISKIHSLFKKHWKQKIRGSFSSVYGDLKLKKFEIQSKNCKDLTVWKICIEIIDSTRVKWHFFYHQRVPSLKMDFQLLWSVSIFVCLFVTCSYNESWISQWLLLIFLISIAKCKYTMINDMAISCVCHCGRVCESVLPISTISS